jgi:aryl-alcohol dehydrogenase-like predicted oxidoreductase
MQYRTFGRTDWQVSEIAFGGWQLGGDWGPVDDAESIKTLHHAYDRGINFVDTAELYGSGHSEEVIGESLRQWRGDKIYVATKVQPTVWPDPDDDQPAMRGRYPEWHLRAAVEGALRRLGVERIDLFQLHCWLGSGIEELDWLETSTPSAPRARSTRSACRSATTVRTKAPPSLSSRSRRRSRSCSTCSNNDRQQHCSRPEPRPERRSSPVSPSTPER